MRPTIALAVATLMATGAFAQNAGEPAVKREFTKGDIRIVEPWARATPGSAKVAAGYVTITNAGKAADRLVGGRVSAANKRSSVVMVLGSLG